MDIFVISPTYARPPVSLVCGVNPCLFFQLHAIFLIAHQTSVTLVFWVIRYSIALLCLKIFQHAASLGLNFSNHACMHTHKHTTHKHVHSQFERLTSHQLGLCLDVALFISEALPDQSSHFVLHIDTYKLKALASLFLHNLFKNNCIDLLLVSPHEDRNHTVLFTVTPHS